MLITNHWSGSPAVRLRDYHVEIVRTGEITDQLRHTLREAWGYTDGSQRVDWKALLALFTIYKNDELSQSTEYGTWDLNHDPRDGSPNIEIASMCMPGGATAFAGDEPFTIAHAWVHTYATAAVSAIKKAIDVLGKFDVSAEPSVLQNGPIFVVSNHGERADQTQNPGVAHPDLGYFFGSGDPDSRADLFCLDGEWYTGEVTLGQCKSSIAEMRWHAHVLKSAGLEHGLLGLDGPETP